MTRARIRPMWIKTMLDFVGGRQGGLALIHITAKLNGGLISV